MASLHFACATRDGGLEIKVLKRTMLGTKIVPVAQWPGLDKPMATYAAAVLKRGRANADSVSVGPAETARLPKSVIDAVGAPPLSDHAARLAFKDRAESPLGKIALEWRDRNRRAATVSRQGAILSHGARPSIASAQTLAMLDAVEAYNATLGREPMERIAAFLPVQEILKGVTGRDFATDQYLETLTIHQAGALAVDMAETEDGLSFDVILMKKAPPSAEADDNAAPEDDEEAATAKPNQDDGILLTPAQQQAFAAATRKAPRGKRAYAIGRNAFVVLTPEVEVALNVVMGQRAASAAERRAFARNPRAAIAEAIRDAGLGADSDSSDDATPIFVETQQYSDRVIEFGLWERPDLPGIAHKHTDGEGGMLAGVDFGNAPGRMPQAGAGGGSSSDPADARILISKDNTKTLNYAATVAPRQPMIPLGLPLAQMAAARPKDHQTVGIDWLMTTWTQGHPGVLLADDMGLGKTYQTLVFAAWLKQAAANSGKGPIIVIAPTSLLKTWRKEAAKYLAPDALGTVVQAFGKDIRALRERARLSGRGDTLDVETLRGAGWILTTYETMADHHLAFSRVPVALAIFDEIQKIKDPRTINAAAALTINADFLLALTGTPVENRMEDLWTIMDRVWPGYLGCLKDFSARYGSAEESRLRELKDLLDKPNAHGAPIMLRRMKKDHIKDLPQRDFIPYETTMPAVQQAAYDAVLEAAKRMGRAKGAALMVVQRLGAVSVHPSTLDPKRSLIDPYDPRQAAAWFAGSGRTASTLDILRQIKAHGEKAIVFIGDHHVQDMFVGGVTTLLGLPQEPKVINGDVPGEKRQGMVDEFEARGPGFDLMVLSPRAAGVGLTIIEANHVIHLSRWWNPAVEDQCNDRVYRIGQKRPVKVYTPMAVHPALQEKSYDKRLDNLLAGKRFMSQNLLAPPVGSDVIDRLLEGAST